MSIPVSPLTVLPVCFSPGAARCCRSVCICPLTVLPVCFSPGAARCCRSVCICPLTAPFRLFQSRSGSLLSVCSAGEVRYGTVTVRGDVQLAVRYLPSDGALELTVHQCRNLAAADSRRNKSDPYVKYFISVCNHLNTKQYCPSASLYVLVNGCACFESVRPSTSCLPQMQLRVIVLVMMQRV